MFSSIYQQSEKNRRSPFLLRRKAALFAICLAVLTAAQVARSASPFGLIKDVRWDVTIKGSDPLVPSSGPGIWRWALHVLAECDDKIGTTEVTYDHNDIIYERGSRDFKKEQLRERRDAKPTLHLAWIEDENGEPFKFNQTTGLDKVEELTAENKHPKANVKVELKVGKPYQVGDIFFADAKVILNGYADALQVRPLKADEVSYAEAFGAGDIRLVGRIESSEIIDGKMGKKKAGKKTTGKIETGKHWDKVREGKQPKGGPNRVKLKDPIVWSLYDEVTEVLIAEQQLWREEWIVENKASIEWNETDGLILIAQVPVGMASIEFETMSSWVLNPFNGSASIVDGQFTPTGDLSGLAWIIELTANQVKATLPVSELDPNFSFEIQADGLGTPPNDIISVGTFESRGKGKESASIADFQAYLTFPEDGSLIDTREPNLSWLAGLDANSHNIWVGTHPDFMEPYAYELPGTSYKLWDLENNTTYYWRVDEVQDSNDVITGAVWSFTTPYEVLDKFESGVLEWESVWGFSTLSLSYDQVYNGLASLQIGYEVDSGAFFDYPAHRWGFAADWSGAKSMSLFVLFRETNSLEAMLSLILYDGSSTASSFFPGELRGSTWTEWNIDMRDFNSIDLSNVEKITLWIDGGFYPGTMNVDDVIVYQARCMPEMGLLQADFDGNCQIDLGDLKELIDVWLGDTDIGAIDVYTDGIINWRDYSVLASEWLKGPLLWPSE